MQPHDSRISQVLPEIEHILEVENPTVDPHLKSRIKLRLKENVELLLDKKQKEALKKERVRMVEEQLERQREMKIRQIVEKSNKSERVMELNRDAQNKKMKLRQDYFQKIVEDHKFQEERLKEDTILRQKQFQQQNNPVTKRKSRYERTITTLDATIINPEKESTEESFVQLSKEIEEKSLKARDNHDKRTRLIVDRMKHRSQCVQSVQEKALQLEREEAIQSLEKWNRKVDIIETFQQNNRKGREKRMLERRQSLKNKIDRCSHNLEQITSRQERKYEELREKLESIKAEEKEWKDLRLEKYWRLWEKNKQKIEKEKRENGNRILKKHQQITSHNKVYKEKRDRLIQVVKKI